MILKQFPQVIPAVLFAAALLWAPPASFAQDAGVSSAEIDYAVGLVKPSLVRIHVVETYYREGRELKYEASGSGAVITAEGHVITNHHVAGHAKLIKCTFPDKEEISAELVGTDPLTDIAILKLTPETPREFAVARFGDSDTVRVGQAVLAMGSPQALSQSVTLGIISNTEMILPSWMSEGGGLELDGENVGALVRWLAHDAAIYGGNSGGPLVNLAGEIVGINEISLGLSGAIPGNLAKQVAETLIAHGRVDRAWLGLDVQPLLKHAGEDEGVLVSGVVKDSPADAAGILSGDILLSVGETPVNVKFDEQLPDYNLLITQLPIGEPVSMRLRRGGAEMEVTATPKLREPQEPEEFELKQWGITVRDLSEMMAKELKRPDAKGVLITSVRPGGPVGSAKPTLNEGDVITGAGELEVASVAELIEATHTLTKDATGPTSVLTRFERKTGAFVTVVNVGVEEITDPGLEVKKAWLPVETQVITRDIAKLLGDEAMTGFRVTRVFEESTAEAAGIEVGDLILGLDGENLTASAPEHYEELEALVRQYRAGSSVSLQMRRGGEDRTVEVELVRAPPVEREMKKYRDDDFEFTARDITFFDKSSEKWAQSQKGVIVHQVNPGGWAALGGLANGDLIVQVGDSVVADVVEIGAAMDGVRERKEKAVVFKVMRGIHTRYIEIEPKWSPTDTQKGSA